MTSGALRTLARDRAAVLRTSGDGSDLARPDRTALNAGSPVMSRVLPVRRQEPAAGRGRVLADQRRHRRTQIGIVLVCPLLERGLDRIQQALHQGQAHVVVDLADIGRIGERRPLVAPGVQQQGLAHLAQRRQPALGTGHLHQAVLPRLERVVHFLGIGGRRQGLHQGPLHRQNRLGQVGPEGPSRGERNQQQGQPEQRGRAREDGADVHGSYPGSCFAGRPAVIAEALLVGPPCPRPARAPPSSSCGLLPVDRHRLRTAMALGAGKLFPPSNVASGAGDSGCYGPDVHPAQPCAAGAVAPSP